MEITISFPGKTTAEANVLAAELQNEIQMSGEPVKVERVRENPDSQDFGATLLLVLAAPAAVELAKGAAPALVELAKGIAAWMRRKGTSISVKCGDKDVVVKDVDSTDLPGVMAAVCGGAPVKQ
jgi:hypothetical protein